MKFLTNSWCGDNVNSLKLHKLFLASSSNKFLILPSYLYWNSFFKETFFWNSELLWCGYFTLIFDPFLFSSNLWIVSLFCILLSCVLNSNSGPYIWPAMNKKCFQSIITGKLKTVVAPNTDWLIVTPAKINFDPAQTTKLHVNLFGPVVQNTARPKIQNTDEARATSVFWTSL